MKRPRRKQWYLQDILNIAGIVLCAAVAVVCAVLLIRYAVNAVRARQVNDILAAMYHEEETTAPAMTEAPDEAAAPAVFTAAPTATPVPTETAAPVRADAAATATYDPFGGYPNNPYRQVAERFKPLQKVNQDICAWITIDEVMDQAVVQRDNSYYLDRDYTGQPNANGAIFLDEQVWLNFRPDCYILYGHNMKTEAMFGMLHRYGSIAYLRSHPMIEFDTMYEDGRYAIFACGTLALEQGRTNGVEYYSLPGAAPAVRERIISRLKEVSAIAVPLEVEAQDQLLLLITCNGNDAERFFVAARRLRDGESDESLRMTYSLSQQK